MTLPKTHMVIGEQYHLINETRLMRSVRSLVRTMSDECTAQGIDWHDAFLPEDSYSDVEPKGSREYDSAVDAIFALSDALGVTESELLDAAGVEL